MSKDEVFNELKRFHLSTNGKVEAKEKYLYSFPELTLKKILCALNRTNNLGSITNINGVDLPREIDLLTYSFPCQDLSICGSWHGNMTGIDRNVQNRSGMLWEVERILYERKEQGLPLPKFLLMENVNNILSPKHIEHFEEWKSSLKNLKYVNQVYTLNANNFSSPQKRVRTYMLSVFSRYKDEREAIETYFSENNLENHPAQGKRHLEDFLRTDYSVPSYKEEADLSNRNDTPSRQMILENAEVLFDGKKVLVDSVKTLTTKQDRNPTSGVLMYPEHRVGGSEYRNLTPRECFLLMGFDEDDFDRLLENNIEIRRNTPLFKRERLERLAGNSIVVDVLVPIFRQVDEIKELIREIREKKREERRRARELRNNG